ncbi:hypothetical protein O5O45_28295 [Hahella aquimaris]|uniref:hypothetical protein n=1 Tax=Hahella sp. HNIBRBA332 TaxID=3015983 RepID=UPI00273B8F56|nr:hypothetical protein [Hahella sp. HNIBRBA332]WLQ13633.1 hypothetical protein O5O45_28295 [Hahella sp. HNIBRBA332]
MDMHVSNSNGVTSDQSVSPQSVSPQRTNPVATSTPVQTSALAGNMEAGTSRMDPGQLQSSFKGFEAKLPDGSGEYFSKNLKSIDATLTAANNIGNNGSASLAESFFVKEDATYLSRIKEVMLENANLSAKTSSTGGKDNLTGQEARRGGDDQLNRLEQYRTPNKPLEGQKPLSSDALNLLDKELKRTHSTLQYKLNTIERMNKYSGDEKSLAKVKGLTKGEAYSTNIRPKLESKDIMLLPQGAPLAGVFPQKDHLKLSGSEDISNFDRLVEHANKLLTEYNLTDVPEANDKGNPKDKSKNDTNNRILPNKTGCVCIMYAKEKNKAGEVTYIPFFGVSGTAKSKDDMVDQFGLPPLINNDQLDNTGSEKTLLGKTMQDRFFGVLENKLIRDHLGLKNPSLQATMSAVTYENKIDGGREGRVGTWADQNYGSDKQDIRKHSSQIESWNSLHCAEPAAVLAAANLYPRMADMDLSIPYEATLSDQRNVNTFGKHTCGRCAISEVRFAGYAENNARVEVKMYSVLLGNQNTIDNELSLKNTLNDSKLLNNKSQDGESRQAYGSKFDDMEKTIQLLHDLGIHHSSSSPFAREAGAEPGIVKQTDRVRAHRSNSY